MDERISIVTPDHVELDFEPAGIGSRLLAQIIDWLLILVLLVTLAFLLVGVGLVSSFTQRLGQVTGAWGVAILLLFAFLVIWGYFLFFEALNKGQTPGKRRAGIRVIRDDGLPVGWRESALRNLARAADICPPPACIVGGLMIVFSKRAKRLGDLLAGTMVVREDFEAETRGRTARWEAAWVTRVERGRSRRGIVLADMKIDARQVQIIKRFLDRRESLPVSQRQTLAWRIASPFLKAMGEDPADLASQPDRYDICERVLSQIMERANAGPQQTILSASEDSVQAKLTQWMEFSRDIETLQKAGNRGLRRLKPDELTGLIDNYRRLACDLARARSIGRDSVVVRHLNDIAVRAHNVVYGHIRTAPAHLASWWTRFPVAVRNHLAAVLLSAVMMFGPALISYLAVQIHPELGYDLVSDGFLNFEPDREESLHNIPSIARPIAASGIVTNNIQVTLLAFGLGMTAGLGTCLVLVFNGVHLGAVAGWLTAKGDGRALWGWIMPHGGTELLAITLSGAAGFVLARALVAPGNVRRSSALREVAMDALAIEVGVMVMLIFAGLIEGFVSPSSIGYGVRITFLAVSLFFWFAYLLFAGRTRGKRAKTV